MSYQEISMWDDYFNTLDELKQYKELGSVESLSKRVREEDVLKFYYCESLDKYLVGRRHGTMYYADITEMGDLHFFMSRYLPWGEHVVSPDTLWKEYTYPSEPKEIHFTEWLRGYIKQRYNIT